MALGCFIKCSWASEPREGGLWRLPKALFQREEFEHLRDGEGNFRILLWSLQALPKRLGLKRLCPQSHSNKFRGIFGPLSKETEA